MANLEENYKARMCQIAAAAAAAEESWLAASEENAGNETSSRVWTLKEGTTGAWAGTRGRRAQMPTRWRPRWVWAENR